MGLTGIPAGSTKATYGVTDTLMLFSSSKNKELAMKFLTETAFSTKWRTEFTKKEGFLPVMKAVASAPDFANDPQLTAFTNMLPYAHFAPPVANWEQIKKAEKGRGSVFDGIPATLPALLLALKTHKKAASVGVAHPL